MGFDDDPSAKEATCFLSTVKRLLPEGYKEDPKGLKFILQCFAYSLMPRKMKPYYFICHGKQGSGKSSLVRVLKELAGAYFVSKPMRAVFSQFGKPGLVGKLVVCDDDISDDYVLPTEIKTLMANESVTVEEKGKPQYNAVMNLAPWIIGNRPPKVTGSDGHDRRAVVMFFSSTEPGDPHHMDKMFGKIDGHKDERAAIMNMILREIPEFVKTWDFDRPEWANDAHKEWITSSNSVASYFSENRELDNDHWYLRRAVYLHYAEWAELSGMKPVTSDVFYKSLAGEKIETKGKGKSVRIKCPFSLPDLDREKMQILKTDQIGERVHSDTIPF
jgi:phage/plasmid-associated DNA primase